MFENREHSLAWQDGIQIHLTSLTVSLWKGLNALRFSLLIFEKEMLLFTSSIATDEKERGNEKPCMYLVR